MQKSDQTKVVDMKARIEAARKEEQEKYGTGGPDGDNSNNEIPPTLIRQCLDNNERGDGILYSRLHQNNFTHVSNVGQNGQWMYWTGNYWETDREDLAHNAVEEVAQCYFQQELYLREQAKKAEDEGNTDKAKSFKNAAYEYKKRVSRLRSSRGAKVCLEWSHKIGNVESLSTVSERFDQKPWLLPCPNGVVDLQTGKLTPGRPEDLLSKHSTVEYHGIDVPAPNWEQFIEEIHQVDEEIISFVRRTLGYAITGLTTEHFIACFVGEGRNGKGTMFEIIKAILGELAWAIQPEMILEQRYSKSSAGPSPDLISLQGRRLVIASETDENRKISGSKIKMLTGGDSICARAPHDRFETNFRPTHTLFLYTNHIPSGLTKDFALYKRLLFLQYPLKFVDNPNPADPNERPRDPDLPNKLAKEAPGILAWLVRGCLEWQERGLDPPQKIRADVEELRVNEDTFQQFFNERLIAKPGGTVRFADAYNQFAAWYSDEIDESERYRPSKKKISAWLAKRGFERAKPGGIATFHGLELRPQP